MFVLLTLFILVKHTVMYLWLHGGMCVGIARQECWLACCNTSSGTLNRMVVCVMEYRVCVGNTGMKLNSMDTNF